MYVSRGAWGMGAAGPDLSSSFAYVADPSQVPVEVDTVTVSAAAGVGPLCFSGFLFPWLGRQDGSSGTVVCKDLLAYNGVNLGTPVRAVVTAGIGLLVLGALFGGRR